MRTSLIPILLLSLFVGFSCNQNSHFEAPRIQVKPIAIGNVVPSEFENSATWNSKSICPPDATVSSFSKYQSNEADKRESDADFYFGRDCEIVKIHENMQTRSLASAANGDPFLDTTVVPHGKFIYWYPNGKVMSVGEFSYGSVAGEWKFFTSSGSLSR